MPTVIELKRLAKSRGLTGYSKMRKEELEYLLQAPPPTPKPRTKFKKDVIFWYYVKGYAAKKFNLPKNTKFISSLNEIPSFNNKTLSQIKTLVFQKIRRNIKKMRKDEPVNELREYELDAVFNNKPVYVTLIIRAVKPENFKHLQVIKSNAAGHKPKTELKSLTAMSLKGAKLDHRLPDDLYERVREKKFKKVMNQI